MLIEELQNDFTLYLLGIKQSFESGLYQTMESGVLKQLFNQGVVYFNILQHTNLCTPHVVACLSNFCKLVEDCLPPPQVLSETTFVIELIESNRQPGALTLPQTLGVEMERLFAVVALELITIFQIAILELSTQLTTEASLSLLDIENTNYVVGMCEITCANLEATLANAQEITEGRGGQQFLSDAVRFAASLRTQGIGYPN